MSAPDPEYAALWLDELWRPVREYSNQQGRVLPRRRGRPYKNPENKLRVWIDKAGDACDTDD